MAAAGCLYSPRVNAEFNWWLLIVGLVVGAGLVWLILADSARREADVTTRERASEARWIAEELRRGDRPIADADVPDVLDLVTEVLELHAAYLAAPPPDEPAPGVDRGPTGPTPPREPEVRTEAAVETRGQPSVDPRGGGDGYPA
jgi:hypothetical protein